MNAVFPVPSLAVKIYFTFIQDMYSSFLTIGIFFKFHGKSPRSINSIFHNNKKKCDELALNATISHLLLSCFRYLCFSEKQLSLHAEQADPSSFSLTGHQ